MFKYSKDRVNISTVLDTRRAKASGKYPVKIQICFNREQKYYTTGKDLTADEWEKLPTSKQRAAAELREEIEASFGLVRDIVRELTDNGDFSFAALNTRLRGATSSTVNAALREKAKRLYAENRFSAAKMDNNTLKNIELFAGDNIPFSNITPKWLRQFEEHELNRGLSRTSIAIHLTRLRLLLNEAKRSGVIKEAAFPFGRGKYEIQQGEGRKLALTLEQIKRIATYDDGNDTTAKYRDYWLFMYLCNGINAADFIKLRYRDIIDGEICFVRQKTEKNAIPGK